MDIALKNAEEQQRSGGTSQRGLLGFNGRNSMDFISLVSQLPVIGDGYASEARNLKAMSDAQERENSRDLSRDNENVVPGMSPSFDPVEVARKIYPILEFRDKIVKAINKTIAMIPGLEDLIERISETLTAFVLGLLAPFIRPILDAVTKSLKQGSSGVISASAKAQFEPWDDPQCTNPTHSMLSKDHFTNILNPAAGHVAATVLRYAAP